MIPLGLPQYLAKVPAFVANIVVIQAGYAGDIDKLTITLTQHLCD
jgi:hypothetical protein